MCDMNSVEEWRTVYASKAERLEDLLYGLRWLERQTKARLQVLDSQHHHAEIMNLYWQEKKSDESILAFGSVEGFHRILCEAKIRLDEIEDEIFVETSYLYKIGVDVAIEEGRLRGLREALSLTPAYCSEHRDKRPRVQSVCEF